MNLTRVAVVSSELLLAHKVRTALSCSAIFVGVCAVVLMVGTGQAAKKDLLSRIQSMGTNVLMVQAGLFEAFGTHQQQVATFTSLVPRDVELLRQGLPALAAASGYVSDGKLAAYKGNKILASVAGVEPSYFTMQRITLKGGRFFGKDEARGLARVAVVGTGAAKDLFGGENPLGRAFRLEGVPFQVIGVAVDPGTASAKEATEAGDETIYIPLDTALVRVLNVSYLNAVYLQTRGEEALRALPPAIAAILRRSHKLREGKPNDFTIQDPVALLKAEHDTGQAFEALVGGVAGISLFTGGIGIMAIMLMSVRERTSEIGLRRAMGATRRDVMVQFLLEAATLSGLGGAAGALMGLAGNALASRMAGWPLVWPWAGMAGALGLSVALGVLFGLAPAIRAAGLEPATALQTPG